MKKVVLLVSCFLLGIVFWIPDIIIHAIQGDEFDAGAVLVPINILPVLCAVFIFYRFTKNRYLSERKGIAAILFLLGIWFSGPFAIVLGAYLAHGPFSEPGSLDLLFSNSYRFIETTFVLSTWDGTLGAVVIVTIWMLCLATTPLVKRIKKRYAH